MDSGFQRLVSRCGNQLSAWLESAVGNAKTKLGMENGRGSIRIHALSPCSALQPPAPAPRCSRPQPPCCWYL